MLYSTCSLVQTAASYKTFKSLQQSFFLAASKPLCHQIHILITFCNICCWALATEPQTISSKQSPLKASNLICTHVPCGIYMIQILVQLLGYTRFVYVTVLVTLIVQPCVFIRQCYNCKMYLLSMSLNSLTLLTFDIWWRRHFFSCSASYILDNGVDQVAFVWAP